MALKPYARPDVRDEDIAAVCDVLTSQFLTTGPKVPELENSFARKVACKEAVACSNGTTALHLASLAIGLKPGDKVIVPSLTFLATANAVRMCGADVVFCDVDPQTGIVTLDEIRKAEEKCGAGIVAVYPVHIGGYCADMQAISNYARKKGWKIVEDACHALGGNAQGHPVGACAYSDLACFSLHATKSFTAAEGGVITTNDPQLATRMRKLRSHGMEPDPQTGPWAYKMTEMGYNYRLSDLQAVLALSQLTRMDEVAQIRAGIVERYRRALEGRSPYVQCVVSQTTGRPLLHLFQILIDFDGLGKNRAQVMTDLSARAVGTQVHYIPVCDQPYYTDLYGPQDMPGAHRFYDRVLALPLYCGLGDDDVEDVISAVCDVLFS
jgi:UDP-4-amino-4,6-dideoxy-N-acetyl-beta-L-altrosamine transaminase